MDDNPEGPHSEQLEKKIEMVGKCKSDAEIENAVLEGDLKFPHSVSLL